jgi:hypothetical protein
MTLLAALFGITTVIVAVVFRTLKSRPDRMSKEEEKEVANISYDGWAGWYKHHNR